MKKHLCIYIGLIVGTAICLWAPLAWRLVGVFCIGGGCYAIIEALKMLRIQREIERYEASEAAPQAVRAEPTPFPLRAARRLFTMPQKGRVSVGTGWQVHMSRRIQRQTDRGQRVQNAVRGSNHRAAFARIMIFTFHTMA